jgi:hypothetical protein
MGRGWLAIAALATGCGPPPDPPGPDAAVRTALALAVGLLEAKDYAGFAGRFVPPAELAADRADGKSPAETVAARLGEPDRLLARLRLARGASPAFDPGQTAAVFEAAGDGGPVRVVFRKVGGRWYLDSHGGER